LGSIASNPYNNSSYTSTYVCTCNSYGTPENDCRSTNWDTGEKITINQINQLRSAIATEYNIRGQNAPNHSYPALNDKVTALDIKRIISDINALKTSSYNEPYDYDVIILSEHLIDLRQNVISLQNVCICNCDYCNANGYNCSCNTVCSCNCNDYCACNCNYCSCNCDYCSCNCNYCACNCNNCACNCNYCACNCNYTACSCNTYNK